jgi:hypothetical protein
VAIAYNKFINIGYDPTITTPTYTMPVVNASPNPWNRVIKIQVAGQEDEATETMGLIIDTCLFSSHSVQGRGTHVFACLHPSYEKEKEETRKGKGKSPEYGGQSPIMLNIPL